MKLDKLTMKSQELLQSAHELARRKNHTAIEPIHLLNRLLSDREGLGAAILKKIGGRYVRCNGRSEKKRWKICPKCPIRRISICPGTVSRCSIPHSKKRTR